MSTVTLMVTVEMVVGGNDSGDCNGVDGGVSKEDHADGYGDLGRDGWKGEHGDGSHLSQRFHFHLSLTLLTFT